MPILIPSWPKEPRLTDREKEMVVLIIQARPIKEIADEMGISRNTVSQYLAKLYAKLRIHSRAELAYWAMCQHLEAEKRRPAA